METRPPRHSRDDYPETLTLVPVDFETQDLAAESESTTFTRTEPAIFVWLGVVFYLTPSAAHTTLEYIAGHTQPTEVVFDYLQPADTDKDRAHLRARADRLPAPANRFSATSRLTKSPDSCAPSASPTSKTTPPKTSSLNTLANPQTSRRNRAALCAQAAYCEPAVETPGSATST